MSGEKSPGWLLGEMLLFPFSLVLWVAREVEEMAEKERRRLEIETWRLALTAADVVQETATEAVREEEGKWEA